MASKAPPAALVTEAEDGFMPYGAAADFWEYHYPESVLAGPYETGKTVTALHKLNAILCKYANARALMLRKTYRSLIESACVTYERKVLAFPPDDDRCPVRKVGKSKPTAYVYPNGSKIVLGGMDNPGKLLSSEWDVIYINQGEELSLSEWGSLTRGVTGRAGNVKYPMIFADANPGPPSHWMLTRDSLRVFESRHEDNPTLYNQITGEWTDQGRATLAILDKLPGILYQRGRLGKWVAAEGQVYDEFDRALHLIDRFDPPQSWRRWWTVDFGYTNPFVWQEWVEDEDGRLYLYREIYRTGRLVEDHARDILAATHSDPAPYEIICDHDAEGRATLERYLGQRTTAAYKPINLGIQAVQSRLRKAGDGKPRLFLMRDALVERDEALAQARKPCCSLDEIDVYVWPKSQDGRPVKEVPVDEFNHARDAERYLVARVDRIDKGGALGVPPPDDSSDWRRAGSADTMLGALSDVRW